MLPLSLWVYKSILLYLGICFFGVLHHLFTLISTSSSTEHPELWEDRFDGNISFRNQCCKISHSLYINQVRATVFGSLCFYVKFKGYDNFMKKLIGHLHIHIFVLQTQKLEMFALSSVFNYFSYLKFSLYKYFTTLACVILRCF